GGYVPSTGMKVLTVLAARSDAPTGLSDRRPSRSRWNTYSHGGSRRGRDSSLERLTPASAKQRSRLKRAPGSLRTAQTSEVFQPSRRRRTRGGRGRLGPRRLIRKKRVTFSWMVLIRSAISASRNRSAARRLATE